MEAGDILRHVRAEDADWWSGELAGKRGLLPASYVQPFTGEACNQVGLTPFSRGCSRVALRLFAWRPQVQALYAYEATAEDQIGFEAHQVFTLVEDLGDGWAMGEINGRRGVFPFK